jgi:hypothetical protein
MGEPGAAVPRGRMVDWLTRYLVFRATHLPAAPERGASPAQLLEMASVNIAEGVGQEAAPRLRRFQPMLDDLARWSVPVEIDGKLQPWEWLVLPGGQLIKVDSIDHCDAHDPIGCQDIAWDLAGASCELGLSQQEVGQVRRALERAGRVVGPLLLDFHRTCYLSFQLGLHALAARSTDDPDEIARLQRAAARYRRLLAR